ncbi:MAG: hypothetical protein JWM64_1984 [Frankiales bacterium]|nr:hypothetical protein [Frankiales bacterium]
MPVPRVAVLLYAVLLGVLAGVLLGSGAHRLQSSGGERCAVPASATGRTDPCPRDVAVERLLLAGGALGGLAGLGLGAAILRAARPR